MNLSLRTPTTNDYLVLASWLPDAAACQRWAGPRLPFPFAAEDLPTLLAWPEGGESSYALIDSSGRLCGFGQHWVFQAGSVHLGRIIVAPNTRGCGYGRELCQHLITAALNATSATAVTLRVYRDNQVAVKLYSSLGFVECAAESTVDMLFMRAKVNR
jgi:ribosomal protein S18 acetylase RimI-like enzyme